MDMTKREVKLALGIESDAALARQFTPEIGRWAVGQWPDDKPIPARRQWELRARFPGIFGPSPEDPGRHQRPVARGDAAGNDDTELDEAA